MSANSGGPTKNRLPSTQPCQHHVRKQWDGVNIFNNEIWDAERLLEDLGFAASVDPAIPERFVPSLLHRVATMPRTGENKSLWYLNHRILHTLLLHKRKEQRRRLFRYSSVNNKELIESRSQLVNLMQNHVTESGNGKEAGLVRALTGPADCSEKDVLLACQSACRCSLTIPSHESSIAPILSATTSASNIKCPISIYVEPPADQAKFKDGSIDSTSDKFDSNSTEIESTESLQENTQDYSCTQEPPILPNIDLSFQSAIAGPYSKFSKDQRRMVLQRSSAIGRPRSASEPIISQSQTCFANFLPKSLHFHDEENLPNIAILPFSSQNEGLLRLCSIPFLWFRENDFQNNNIYINMWEKGSQSEPSNHISEFFNSEKPTFIRQNCLLDSSRKIPITAPTISLEETSSNNFIFKIKSPLTDFIKLKNILKLLENVRGVKFAISAQNWDMADRSTEHQQRCIQQIVPSDVETIFSELFSLHNSFVYLPIAIMDAYHNKQAAEKTILLVASRSRSHFGNNNRKMISESKLICPGSRDNVRFVYATDDGKIDISRWLGEADTPPITTAMTDSFSDRVTASPVFLSGFSISVGHDGPNEPCFRSAVSLQFNSSKRSQDEHVQEEKAESKIEGKPQIAERKEPPSHSFFRKATKELIELQEYIKKAKISRESASSELQVLQGILLSSTGESNLTCSTSSHNGRELPASSSVDEQPNIPPKLNRTVPENNGKQGKLTSENDTTGMPSPAQAKVTVDTSSCSDKEKKLLFRQLRKNLLRVEQKHYEDMSRMERELHRFRSESSDDSRQSWDRLNALQLMVLQLQNEIIRFQQALSELQKKARVKEDSASAHVEKEIRSKIQQELEQECSNRVSKMEAKLKSAERQLKILQEENNDLRHQLLLDSEPNSHQRTSSETNSFSSTTVNGFISNGEIDCNHAEEKNITEEKLREELRETEEKADRLNLMLDEKVVELNKLQLSLSKRTKEMVLLERAYVQLIYHLYKNGHSLKNVKHLPARLLADAKALDDPP